MPDTRIDPSAIHFGIAAICFYIAARAAAAFFKARRRPVGGLAIAHWLPLAAVALFAARDHRLMAISVVFASSVATILLAMGATLLAAPDRMSFDSPHRRLWGMLLPIGLVVFLIGFAGRFTPVHAALLLIQGIFAWTLWRRPEAAPMPGVSIDPEASAHPQHAGRSTVVSFIAIIIAIALALIGALLAIRAIDELSDHAQRLGEGVAAMLMVAPALMLPILGSALNLTRQHSTPALAADEGHGGAVVSFCVAVVILNLGLLLPAVIVVGTIASSWHDHGAASLTHAEWIWNSNPDAPSAVPFPLGVWRVDSVMLMAVGAMLLPVSAGRWTLRRLDGALLVVGYAVYIIMTAKMALR